MLNPSCIQCCRFLTMATTTYSSTVVDGSDDDIVMMFVGQGAQTVGMTKDVCNIPAVAQMYETAERVLGYDLKQVFNLQMCLFM